MSMQADYIKEREGLETKEYKNGFITYKIFGNECYIQDVYVKPEFRKTKYASLMADEVGAMAKELGCLVLTGSVDQSSLSAETSKKVLISYGMKPFKDIGNMLYFVKEIP